MRNSVVKISFLAVAAVIACKANTLPIGTTVSPDVFTTSTGYTLLGTVSGNINPVPGLSFNASYTEWVFRDANNVFCSTCLDFFIVYSNAGPGTSERLSSSSFDGALLDVGYNTAGINGGPSAPAGGIVPQSVDRSISGNVVGFNFIPPGAPVNSSQSSALLEIQTNAVTFEPGFLSVQDGVAGYGSAYQPSVVPEPKSTSLLIVGFLLLGFVRRSARRITP